MHVPSCWGDPGALQLPDLAGLSLKVALMVFFQLPSLIWHKPANVCDCIITFMSPFDSTYDDSLEHQRQIDHNNDFIQMYMVSINLIEWRC